MVVYINKFWTGAITLFPFIFIKKRYKGDFTYLNHEKIHIEQQKECLVIPFYLLYLLEWIVKSLIQFNFNKGYKSISFEQEAYKYESSEIYLKNRKRFNWLKYVFKN